MQEATYMSGVHASASLIFKAQDSQKDLSPVSTNPVPGFMLSFTATRNCQDKVLGSQKEDTMATLEHVGSEMDNGRNLVGVDMGA